MDSVQEERQVRKQESEEVLTEAGVSINPFLPGIESSSEVTLRAPLDIAQRAICLLLVAATCAVDRETLEMLIDAHGGGDYFTRAEREYLRTEPWEEQEKIQASWRTEAAWVLLWALGLVESLELPTEQTLPRDAIAIINRRNPKWLVSQATPRSVDEILDEADLIFRCHWAVRQSDMDPDCSAGPLDPGVTSERHLAFNWLIDPETEWDDVTTDT